MSIQIQLNICRACLAEDAKTTLSEFSADSEVLKNFQFLINSQVYRFLKFFFARFFYYNNSIIIIHPKANETPDDFLSKMHN